MFEISKIDRNRITLTGRFDASQVTRAQAVFDTVDSSCEVDFSKLEYISSAGLGVLLATYKRLDAAGQRVKLTHMSKLVRDVFRYSRMDLLFEIEE